MKIYFATDHAGYELKNELLTYVRDELLCDVEDCGAFTEDAADDYPDFIAKAAKAVEEDPENRRAIILGGSGTGEAIAANRHRGVRAVVFYGGRMEIISLSREHNDANVLSLGARFLNIIEAKDAVRLWLKTPFSHDDRHARRIEKIENI